MFSLYLSVYQGEGSTPWSLVPGPFWGKGREEETGLPLGPVTGPAGGGGGEGRGMGYPSRTG